MKRLLYITLSMLVFLACKKDSMDAGIQSMGNFMSIQGKWYLSAIERTSIDNAQRTWEPAAAANVDTLMFRTDGVMLDSSGQPACCAPGKLIINGNLLEVKPQTALPPNPLCALVNCPSCSSWDIEYLDNEMIITPCNNNPRRKYVR